MNTNTAAQHIIRKISVPQQVEDKTNGGVRVVERTRWEVRPMHEALTVGKAFPTFATRREAREFAGE